MLAVVKIKPPYTTDPRQKRENSRNVDKSKSEGRKCCSVGKAPAYHAQGSGFDPQHIKPGIVTHIYSSSTWEVGK